jgi:predicted NBD/HSP70 family sugar kinase
MKEIEVSHKLARTKDNLTSKSIRSNNSYNILKGLIEQEKLQRSELTYYSKVSVITVNKIVDKLLTAGILEETTAESSLGRKPKELKFAKDLGCFCCINLCKVSQIGYFIYDIHSRLLEKGMVRVEKQADFNAALTECLNKVRKAAVKLSKPLLGASVSVPSVYYEQEDAVNCDLIPGLKDVHLKKQISEDLGIGNILIIHDVCAAASLEYQLADSDSLYYFYLGDGLGSAYVRRGELIQGDSYAAGEIGQGVIAVDGESYTYESILSIAGLCRWLGASGQEELERRLAQYPALEDWEKRKFDAVFNIAGDLLYNICWILNPGTIIIDSSISLLAEFLQLVTQKKCEQLKSSPIRNRVQVTLPKEKNHYAMSGCVLLLVENWIDEILVETQGTLSKEGQHTIS